MIAGKIKNINMYKGISKNLDKAIDSIIKGEFLGKEPGKYKIDEENVFLMFKNSLLNLLKNLFLKLIKNI
jgi:beta-galactosidase beta subunit